MVALEKRSMTRFNLGRLLATLVVEAAEGDDLMVYRRAFLLDASALLPEPASIALLAFGVVTFLRRRRA